MLVKDLEETTKFSSLTFSDKSIVVKAWLLTDKVVKFLKAEIPSKSSIA